MLVFIPFCIVNFDVYMDFLLIFILDFTLSFPIILYSLFPEKSAFSHGFSVWFWHHIILLIVINNIRCSGKVAQTSSELPGRDPARGEGFEYYVYKLAESAGWHFENGTRLPDFNCQLQDAWSDLEDRRGEDGPPRCGQPAGVACRTVWSIRDFSGYRDEDRH
jgi:hypothetical protein